MKAPEITEADKLKAAIEVRKHTIKVNIIDLWKRVQVRMIEQEISSRFVESEFALHVVYQIPRSLLKTPLSNDNRGMHPPWVRNMVYIFRAFAIFSLFACYASFLNLYLYRECLQRKLRINTWSYCPSVLPLRRCSLRPSIQTRTSDFHVTCG